MPKVDKQTQMKILGLALEQEFLNQFIKQVLVPPYQQKYSWLPARKSYNSTRQGQRKNHMFQHFKTKHSLQNTRDIIQQDDHVSKETHIHACSPFKSTQDKKSTGPHI